ncbi:MULTISPECIES: DUF6191 domain-containing protein [unclassified Streptomyces]|uniref:DUF6191 domain-containing protein n=1 Tax=unclassified Streptomyces TaxID=2593676 RepID=UPI0036EE80C4
MQFVFFMTLPGLVVLLTVPAFVDQLVMRDDEEDGAPPHSTVDLTSGKAVIRLPGARH